MIDACVVWPSRSSCCISALNLVGNQLRRLPSFDSVTGVGGQDLIGDAGREGGREPGRLPGLPPALSGLPPPGESGLIGRGLSKVLE
jgi:hypothetical protein